MKTIRLNDLRHMSEEDREEEFRQLVEAASQPVKQSDIDELTDKLNIYEERYGITSEEIAARIGSGQIKETFDICKWLMLAALVRSMKQLMTEEQSNRL